MPISPLSLRFRRLQPGQITNTIPDAFPESQREFFVSSVRFEIVSQQSLAIFPIYDEIIGRYGQRFRESKREQTAVMRIPLLWSFAFYHLDRIRNTIVRRHGCT